MLLAFFFSSNHFLFASKSVGDFFGSNSKPVGKPRTCCRSRWSSRPRRQGSLPTRPSCRLCTGNVRDWFRPNLSRFLCFSNLEPVARVTLLALTLLGVGVAHLVDIVVIISTFSKDFAASSSSTRHRFSHHDQTFLQEAIRPHLGMFSQVVLTCKKTVMMTVMMVLLMVMLMLARTAMVMVIIQW